MTHPTLSKLDLLILGASDYRRDCGTDHDVCDVCGDLVHAGQLCYTNGAEWFHTRCALPRRDVHQLHQLVTDYRAAGGR